MDAKGLRPYAWALALGIFLPISWILAVTTGPGVAVFIASSVAIIPLAWFMGLATEELGKHAGPGIGGLLNATFGNATELIIAFLAIAGGHPEVAQASITGSIIGNILLVLGISMIAGGIRHKTQVYSREASGVQVSMLLLAVIGLVMPSVYVFASGGASALVLEEMSLFIAAILLVAYVLGLVFSLRTHRDIFNPMTHAAEKPMWTKRLALVILLVATALVALQAELLVGSIEAAQTSLGWSDLFIGVIVVAIVGNAAEHGAAVIMAYRNRMELSVAIATTSTTQVALFVAPILVFASLLTAYPMTLSFVIFEVIAIALSVGVLAGVVADGRSNWYEGALLVMVYAVFAVAFFFLPTL